MKKNKVKAFTLLEQSIVITIIAIISVTLTMLGDYFDYKRKKEVTIERMEILEKAVISFFLDNNVDGSNNAVADAIPCPAPPAIAVTNSAFGVEQVSSRVCQTTNSVVSSDNYFYGAVPVRSMGVPDYLAFDGWGRRFSYAVNQAVTPTPGSDVSDANAATVLFYIISHGENGYHAYTFSGGKIADSADSDETDNSIDAADFQDIEDRPHTGTYDDYVVAKTVSQFYRAAAGGVPYTQHQCNSVADVSDGSLDDNCIRLKKKIMTMCLKN